MITSTVSALTLSHSLSEAFDDESTGLARALVSALSTLDLEGVRTTDRLQVFKTPSHSMHWDAEWPDKALYIASMQDGRAMETLYRVQELQVPIIFVREPETAAEPWELYALHPDMKGQAPDVVRYDLKTGLEGPFTEIEFVWGEYPPVEQGE